MFLDSFERKIVSEFMQNLLRVTAITTDKEGTRPNISWEPEFKESFFRLFGEYGVRVAEELFASVTRQGEEVKK